MELRVVEDSGLHRVRVHPSGEGPLCHQSSGRCTLPFIGAGQNGNRSLTQTRHPMFVLGWKPNPRVESQRIAKAFAPHGAKGSTRYPLHDLTGEKPDRQRVVAKRAPGFPLGRLGTKTSSREAGHAALGR